MSQPDPHQQIHQLEWAKAELKRLQETYFRTLKKLPGLKPIILNFDELMPHLYSLIHYTVRLAQDVHCYYFDRERFDIVHMEMLLGKVQDAQQIILKQIRYLIGYYNQLLKEVEYLGPVQPPPLPENTYQYLNTLKRYLDTEFESVLQEVLGLQHFKSSILPRLIKVNSQAEHQDKQCWVQIQRAISRAVKCYIALGSHTNIQVNTTVGQANLILEEVRSPDSETAIEEEPFVRLCRHKDDILNRLAEQLEWVSHFTNLYFLPKLQEYVPSVLDFFIEFFGQDREVYQAFTDYMLQLITWVQENEYPVKIQEERVGIYKRRGDEMVCVGSHIRDREVLFILWDEFPEALKANLDKGSIVIPEKTPYLLQLGIAYFDAKHPPEARYHTPPSGYFMFFLHEEAYGRLRLRLSKEKKKERKVTQVLTEIGNFQYHALSNELLHQWKDLILYHLIVLERRYRLPLPQKLRDYLVEVLPVYEAPPEGPRVTSP